MDNITHENKATVKALKCDMKIDILTIAGFYLYSQYLQSLTLVNDDLIIN